MNRRFILRNQTREQTVNLHLLRRVVVVLVGELLQQKVHQLGIYILSSQEMTRLNETFVRHEGVTDVIAFNYGAAPGRTPLRKTQLAYHAPEPGALPIDAEIFVCLDVAKAQAHRFRTTWQKELVRYIVHGLLHVVGYDDHAKPDRLRMKRRENQLLNELSQKFSLERLGRTGTTPLRVGFRSRPRRRPR